MFVVTVHFTIAPAYEAAFREAMLEQARASLALEDDCHVFDVCFPAGDNSTVFLYEKYTDAVAFDVHLASSHFKSFNTLVTPWVTSKTVNTWLTSGDSR